MLKALQADQQMPGASESWLMTCDDTQKYVVKFNETGFNTVINEFVCNKIAGIMDLPVARGELVFVDKGLADAINLNPTKTRKIMEGIHFGTLYLKPSSNLDPAGLLQLAIQKIVNEDKVPGMIVFDILVCNGDRSTNNSLITPLNPTTREYQYVMMDHSHCFGGSNWNEQLITNLSCQQVGIPWKTTGITSASNFLPYILRICIVKKEIRNIVNSMPTEWKTRPDELEALIKWIESRQGVTISGAAKNMRASFPNWVE